MLVVTTLKLRDPITHIVKLEPDNSTRSRQTCRLTPQFSGRAQVRRTLYMAAVAAMRCNPVIRSFYQHLRSQGKPAKVALTACMRKLLVTMNAMLKHHSAWSNRLDTQHSC